MRAICPECNGDILGTLERISGRAEINADSFTRLDNGTLDYEHAGGTEIFWDDQETVLRPDPGLKGITDGAVFLCEQGHEVLESAVVLVDAD